jgi:predicted nuclease of predicted toxin-antitoxin system
VKFIVDAMFPGEVAGYLAQAGHEAVTPIALGAHTLPDSALIEIATVEGLVIVTENAADFADVATCTVLLVRKNWWLRQQLASRLAAAIDRWAVANPAPGPWAHWLDSSLR